MSNSITVASSDVSVTIDMANGGRLSSVQWRDLELTVVQRAGPLSWGWYAMAPWAGRVRDGILNTPHGAEHLPTKLMPPHAIHGLLFDAEIRPGDVGDHEAMVWCDLPSPYQGGRVEQRIVVGESMMTWSVSYRNGERPMPAWLGFHPWFRRTLSRGGEAEIFNPAAFMMELDDQGIPVGNIHGVTPPPWDDTFGGMNGAPSVTWPGAIKMTCISKEPWWVIYTRDSMGVCVEPQNSPPHAAALGLAPILAPGEEIRVDYRFNFEVA